ncbi:MAG: DUF5723 family protein [Aestuariibaculum sp.]
MQKKILSIILIITAVFSGESQSYSGFLTDNYSGVNSVISNPANVVDSRFKADINIAGISTFVANDYYGVNIFDAIKDSYDFDLDAKKSPSTNNNANFNVDILGPSFMFNLTQNSSLAIFTRGRTFFNVNEVNGHTIDAVEDDTIDDFSVNEGNFNTFAQAWAELGVTFARVLINNNQHFLKGGITLKYLQGGGSAYAFGKNVTANFDADAINIGGGVTTGELVTTGEVTYARSANFDDDNYDYELPKNANGFGADLGFVYEWRPNQNNHTTTNTSGNTYSHKNENKYKLKLGLSITDFGSIKYKDGIEEVFDINNTVAENDIDNEDNISDILNNLYTRTSNTNGYKTHLPTALHLNADWSFSSKFYLNLNTDLSLVNKNKENASHISNVVSLTPRFESRWFSFYLPLNVVESSGFQMGAGLRAGPLYIGSGSLLSVLVDDNSKGADVYAGIKIPIYQGKAKDRDGDGVINKLDSCPKVPGPAENNGCPWQDTDSDGVFDNEDNCIETAGPVENNGCPWGDKDNDGILDNIDKCPEIPGLEAFSGCPDTDGDGIQDSIDKCPNEVGTVSNNGCPWKDTDGDGVYDKDDKCPETKGTIANSGCPEITKEVQQALNSYAKTILFNTAKSTIKSESHTVLNDIIGVLNQYPNAKFSIEGHTDSVGSSTSNQRLSEYRASAVMTFLIENGISSSRLTSLGYGESKPISDNNTAEGRARNRRVEINLVK